MGIRMLNSFLREKAKKGIALRQMASFKGGRIVVDASIYLYRYSGENMLIENYYLLCCLFRKYGISALFVFDGTPPQEKSNELKERATVKKKAKTQMKQIEEELTQTTDHAKKRVLKETQKKLSKQCIQLKKWHMHDVKTIITACGHQWIHAPAEADHLCAKLVKDGYADACLSEDMDMFVHGCPRVFRYMSLTKESFVEYNLSTILSTLRMTFHEFQELCILAGTDYTKWMENMEGITSKNIFQHYQDIRESQGMKGMDVHSIRAKKAPSPIRGCHLNDSTSTPYIAFDSEDGQSSKDNRTRFDALNNWEECEECEECDASNSCMDSSSSSSYFTWCLDHQKFNEHEYTQLQHIQSFFEPENYPELENEKYKPSIELRPMDQHTLRTLLGYHHFY